ncbi:hypothetical protein GGR51DRAFT_497701 [Nemania sp. FL0031]|nr:hypothetical protein GGR51DRAFT_497701 [Nemania sp. FL0031]
MAADRWWQVRPETLVRVLLELGAAPALPTDPGFRGTIGLILGVEPHRSADKDDPEWGECMEVVDIEDDHLLLYMLRHLQVNLDAFGAEKLRQLERIVRRPRKSTERKGLAQ